MNKVYTLDFEKYSPISFAGLYVHEQFDVISGFIRKNFDEKYHNVLLKPIKLSSKVDFYSKEKIQFKSVNDFPEQNRNELLKIYNALLFTIDEKCKLLEIQDDRDNVEWATLLRCVFNYDNNLVLSDGINLKIVWGWKFDEKQKLFLPLELYSDLLQKTNHSNEKFKGISDEEEILSESGDDEDYDETFNEETDRIAKEKADQLAKEEADRIARLKADQLAKEEADRIAKEKADQLAKEEADRIAREEANRKANEEKKSRQQNEFKSPKKNYFFKFLNSIEHLFNRYWWIVLIFALIIIVLFWFKGCELKFQSDKSDSQINLDDKELVDRIYKEIMPKLPRKRIKPIKPIDIIEDTISHGNIVSNVVNIALKNKNDDFKKFCIELKNNFSDKDFQITYFDDQTRRLQFSFPASSRNLIKDTIRNRLKKYQLLIWDESIFSNSKNFSDPGFNNINSSWHLKKINAEKAWNITTGDPNIVVAVIDDGFDLKHVDLMGKFVKPYNVVTDTNVITSGSDNMHGTHVAGIAVARGNNGYGVCGIAPNCSFMPIQATTGDAFAMTDIIDGILYAIYNKADVINLSLGKYFPKEIENYSESDQLKIADKSGIDEAQFWDELFSIADSNNVTIVIAAGNQNLIVGMDPMSRSQKTIKVSAIDSKMQKANFSNYFMRKFRKGSAVSAPGEDIYSSIPGNNFEYFSGTSMAAPIVAGSIALMKSVNRNLSNSRVMEILNETSIQQSDKKLPPIIQVDKLVLQAKK